MEPVVEAVIPTRLLQKHDRALKFDDERYVRKFWNNVAEDLGVELSRIPDILLDNYNSGSLSKTGLDHYMSSLASVKLL